MKRTALPLFLLITAAAQPAPFTFPAPSIVQSAQPTRVTWYHVYPAPDRAATGVALLSPAGDAVSQPLSPRDWCSAALEGTVQTRTPGGAPVTLNYAQKGATSQVDCARVLNLKQAWAAALGYSRFNVARGPYGDGVKGNILVPFRTVAADPSVPVGTVLFIPALRGQTVPLPGGTTAVHDGYVMVADRGGGITGAHIDLFVGTLTARQVPAWLGRWSTQQITVQRVNDPVIQKALTALHR